MAETFVTLTFLSAIAMSASIFTGYNKWIPSACAVFSIISFIQLPADSIQQSGGAILVSVFAMSSLLQYYILREINRKVINGLGGVVICLLLLSSYPKDGVVSTIFEYTIQENIIQFSLALFLGLILAQMFVNIVEFNKVGSLVSVAFYLFIALGGFIEFQSELFVIITSSILFGILPFFETLAVQKIGNGDGRTLALGLSVIIGIFIIYLLTYFSVMNESRIGDGAGALAVAMWLTLAVASLGLLGMLLPITGLDHHPRPEGWGFRMALSLSPMVLTFQTDLAIHVLIGIILAIIISITSPMVIEKKPAKQTD